MKRFGKLGAFALALALLLLVPSAAFADSELTPGTPAESDDWRESVAEILPESYRQVDLYADGMLAFPNTCELQTNVPTGTDLPGLELSGTAAQFNNVRIPLSQQFEFTDEWPVGTACLDALKQAGTESDVEASLYLDEDDQPLATFKLKADKSTTRWNSMGNLTQNVLGEVAAGKHSVSIGFQVTGGNEDAAITILLRSIEFMYNSLPVMSFDLAASPDDLTKEQRAAGYGTIDDMNSSRDHSVRTSGSVNITVPEGYQSEFGSQSTVSGLALDYIRGRGNSTWKAFGKRPYRIKLAKKTDLFGMGKNKHWVLLANAMDASLIRNRITLKLGREIGLKYTPKCVPVDVVMNGEYYGSYLLCEQVRIGENRIDISEPEDGVDYKQTGYLFSCAQYGGDERDVFATKHNAALLNVTPSYEDNADATNTDDYLPNIDERTAYLRDYVQEAEDALYGEGFENAQGKSYEDYFDLDSVTKYLWVQTLSWNGDAFGTGSTYFYKKPDTDQGQGKIYWGPLWDFDIAWGFIPSSSYSPDAKAVFHGINFAWIHQLHGNPSFLEKYWDCWTNVVNPAVKEMTREGGWLDQYLDETKVTWAYDKEQTVRSSADDSWATEEGDEHSFPVPGGSSFSSYVGAVRDSATGMAGAINTLGLDELKNSVVSVTLNPGDGTKQTIYLPRHATDVGVYFPDVQPAEDELFLGWARNDSTIFDLESDEVADDMVLSATFVKKDKAIKAQGLFLNCSTVTLGLNDCYSLSWSITPYDAQDKEVVWTSSDESVAIMNADNMIQTMTKPGRATITGTLPSGNSASITVIALDVDRPEYNDPTSITVTNPDLHLEVGAYDQVHLDFQPYPVAPFASTVEWESSNPDVAEVDDLGVVHALKPGTAEITATSIFDISATCKVTVTKAAGGNDAKEKAANPLVVKPIKVKLKAAKLKKKAVKVKAKKAFKVTGAKGKVTYERTNISCKKKLAKQAAKKIKIAKNGKITCKKGLKKGTYKVKVRVKAAGSSSYLPATKNVTLKIVVK